MAKSGFKNWWSGLNAAEKSAMVVLGAIIAGVILFASGTVVGGALYEAIN